MLSDPRVLDFASGATISFQVGSWTLDELELRPATGPKIVRVAAIRLFPRNVLPADSPAYFDVVSQTLIHQLAPWLERSDYRARRFSLTKLGEGPSSRWQLQVSAG
jgi:hypothetical protein